MKQKPLKKLSEKKIDQLLSPLINKAPTEFFQVKKPKESFDQYFGREVRCMDGATVKIEEVVGSMIFPTRFEINRRHHVVILDFFAQMNHDKSITQDQINAFDKMEHYVEKVEKKEIAHE